MKNGIVALAAVLSFVAFTGTAQAAESGDWIIRVGMHNVDPKSNNSPIVNVDSATQVSFDFTYMLTSRLGFEILAALPFEHDVALNGGPVVASTEQLPPTFSINYRFGDDRFQPYVGAGLNYTVFFSEETQGLLAGTDLSLDASAGLALQVGFDYALTERLLFNMVLRSMDIDTDAKLNGVNLTTVEADPLAIGISVGWVF